MTARRRFGRLIFPSVLVQPRRWIAPRSVVGLGDVAAKPVHQGIERRAANGLAPRLSGIGLANSVRVQFPKRGELRIVCGGRAPFRGRRGYGFFLGRGCGGNPCFLFRRICGFRRIPQTFLPFAFAISRTPPLGLFVDKSHRRRLRLDPRACIGQRFTLKARSNKFSDNGSGQAQAALPRTGTPKSARAASTSPMERTTA